ncbi:MAG: T9SS type A sorting domain-containing protein [Ignavibacteriae bacterium]|nr:T9SS type A sorting domain-containing protein [Ignavibacteria bacterium]MBI3365943.1 T9SS type A sorting domain-containing protein [Ignavibacteriota bacterium]
MRLYIITLLSALLVTMAMHDSVRAQGNTNDTIIVQVQLPNGPPARVDTVVEGHGYPLTGFPFPLQYLNGGMLFFPVGSVHGNITVKITLPDWVSLSGNTPNFGDSIANAVRFTVLSGGRVVSPFTFDIPVVLTLPIPNPLPTSIGPQVSALVLSYRDTSGNFDTTGIRTTIRDSVLHIVSAEVSHFSDVVMTSSRFVTTPPSGDTIVVQVKLPTGQLARLDTLRAGDTFRFSGFPFPFQYLNGGKLFFPVGSVSGNVTVMITLPDYATLSGNAANFGDSIASAVRFTVLSGGAVVSPFTFNVPVDLTLRIPDSLPTSIGSQVSALVLSYRDTAGHLDSSGIHTTIRDSVLHIVSAEVSHFSDVVMTSSNLLSGNPDTIVVKVKLPNNQFTRVDTLLEGDTFPFTGFPYPFQYLNGGKLTFPVGSVHANVTVMITLPDWASLSANAPNFGDSIATAVRFTVLSGGNAVSPFVFDLPVELTLRVPDSLPASIGRQVSALVLSYRDTTGNFDTTGIRTTIRDSVLHIVSAEVSHFSDVVMTSTSIASGRTGTSGVMASFSPGWNLVSVPVQRTDNRASSVFPFAMAGTTFGYNGIYSPVDTLTPGWGYWTSFPSAVSQNIAGAPLPSIELTVNQGWNLIGSVDHEVATPTGGVVISNIFGYSNGYAVVTSLSPGQGYWIKTSTAGTITLGGGTSSPKATSDMSSFSSFTIADKLGRKQTLYITEDAGGSLDLNRFELPPSPPAGIFTARYASQRMLETYPSDMKGTARFPIVLQAPEYPLSVEFNIRNADGKGIVLEEVESGNIIASHSLVSNGTVVISGGDAQSLALKVVPNGSSPARFGLSQNYPNPFNPTTNISYSLPVESFVQLRIFDLLGREIASLVNERQTAGTYTVSFDASRLSSGVYFYKIIAGDFTDVKRMLIMK